MLNLIGLRFGEEEQLYVCNALRSFGGDFDKTMGFFKKVADILRLGDDLGPPSRDAVVQTPFERNLDLRVAPRKLREKSRPHPDPAPPLRARAALRRARVAVDAAEETVEDAGAQGLQPPLEAAELGLELVGHVGKAAGGQLRRRLPLRRQRGPFPPRGLHGGARIA